MTISPGEFAATEHRPWPLPRRPWIMAQTWHDLLFAHWPVDPAVLAPHVPASLPLDLWDGRAWIALVPFRMSGIRLRGLPACPGLSAFPELNVRTYVVRDGKPGVWFLSLDAAHRVAVALARAWFHLPYFRADMECRPIAPVPPSLPDASGIRFRSIRTHRGAPPAEFAAEYRPVGPVFHAGVGSFAHWCAERYCLYAADPRGRLHRGEIHHAPWPLQAAEGSVEGDSLLASHHLPRPEGAPQIWFARRLAVRVFALELLGSS